MKLEIDTENKTIKVLEDVLSDELSKFVEQLEDGYYYKITSSSFYSSIYYPYNTMVGASKEVSGY